VAQNQPGHRPRQLARELGASAAREEVHDGHVVGALARRGPSLGRARGNLHPVSLLAQDEGQRLGIARIVLDEEDRPPVAHGPAWGSLSNGRTITICFNFM
jgi:hypothetical protein